MDNDDIKQPEKLDFVSHLFRFDNETKHELSNIIQYTVLAIIPIVVLNKVMKKYIPDADEDKGSFEITFEILLQTIILLLGVFYIHRLVIFVPTYSGSEYPDFHITSFVLILLVIILSLQSKLGDKINILVNRVVDLWNGETSLKEKPKPKQTVKQVVHEQKVQREQDSYQQPQQPRQEQPRQNLPDYNVMYGNNMVQQEETQLLAANEVLGGFGTMI